MRLAPVGCSGKEDVAMLPFAQPRRPPPDCAGSDVGLKLADFNGAVVQAGGSRPLVLLLVLLLILLHLDGDVVGAGGAQGQL